MQIETVHADDSRRFASGEGFQTILRKTTVADEDSPRPLCFALNFAREAQQIALPGWLILSLGLDKIHILPQLKAPINLLADQAERAPGRELEQLEQIIQKSLEGESPLLWRHSVQSHQAVPQTPYGCGIDDRSLRALRLMAFVSGIGGLAARYSRQARGDGTRALNQSVGELFGLKPPEGDLGIDIGQKVVDTQGNRGFVCDLPEPTQSICFRPARIVVFRVKNIEGHVVLEELPERSIRKIKHVAATHLE
jgi:hypothetical protein